MHLETRPPIPWEVRKSIRLFAEGIQKLYGEGLHSIILYGSGVSGDYLPGISDINLLIILKEPPTLTGGQAAPPNIPPPEIKRYFEKNPSCRPILFSEEEFLIAARCFPLEFSEIKEYHYLVHGTDSLKALEIDKFQLNCQCRQELLGRLADFRKANLVYCRSPESLLDLALQWVPGIIAIIKGILRLHNISPPPVKVEALGYFEKEFELPLPTLQMFLRLRMGEISAPRGEEISFLFNRLTEELKKLLGVLEGKK